jgi:periplasmic copper chaperone A
MSRKLAVFLSMVIGALPLAIRADGPNVSATHVWIHTATSETDAMTGYLILQNLSGQTLTLTAISSPDFDSVVIRRGSPNADNHKVQTLSNIKIPAHESLTFAANNYYLVFTRPVKKLYDGDLVTLTLMFSDHSSLDIMAPARHDQPGS